MTAGRRRRATRAAFAGLLLALATGAGAQDNGPPLGTHPAERGATASEAGRMVAAKMHLLDQLLTRSPAARRIDASGRADAVALLVAARGIYGSARTALAAGDAAQAQVHADEALRTFGQANRLVADPERADALQRARYEELHAQVLAFRDAFARLRRERGARTEGLLDEGRSRGLIAQAEELAGQGEHAEANHRLLEASAGLEAALTRAQANETVVHALTFDSPAEEYAYEQERNRSYLMLVQMLARDAPAAGAGALLDAQVRRNAELKSAADDLAGRGDLPGAIARLEEATEALTRGLRAGGLPIP